MQRRVLRLGAAVTPRRTSKALLAAAAAASLLLAVAGCGSGGKSAASATSASATSAPATSAPATDSSTTSQAATSKPLVNISVSYQPDWDYAAAVAQAQGFFKAAGLNVHAVPFSSGPPEVAAMASGHLDFAYTGPGPELLAFEGKGVIVGVNDFSANDYLMASPGSGVKTAADLRGKKVLYAAGSSGQLILELVLQDAGLSMKDITPINVPDPGALVSAFIAGQAPVIATWSPFSDTVKQHMPNVTVVATDQSLYPKITLPDVWMTTAKMVKDHPDVVSRFMWAQMKAMDWVQSHTHEATAIIAKQIGTPVDVLQKSEPPNGLLLVSAQKMVQAYNDGTAASWITNLAKVDVQNGSLSSLPPASDYLDLGPATTAGKRISQPSY